jgi:hypothetical protein
MVHGGVEAVVSVATLKEVVLLPSPNESAEMDANESNSHASIVKTRKQLFCLGNEDGIRGGIGKRYLLAMRLEIRIANLNPHAAGELMASPELKSQVFHHGDQNALQLLHVRRVLVKGALRGDGFALLSG